MKSRFQRGFAAIAALFLVVVLAALGAFMWHMGVTQQLTSAQDVQGSRAYWAARGGLEWGGACVAAGALCTDFATLCPSSPSVLPTKTLTLNAFKVDIWCVTSTYSEASRIVSIFQLLSVASTGTFGTISYVERSVSASIEK